MSEEFLNYITDYKTYTPLYIFVLGFMLKILLDLNLGASFVKYFYWLSVRSLFRIKSPKISGIYKQYWDIENSKKYSRISDRQSLVVLKQLNNYCYGEFTSKNETYYVFGQIIDRKIIGHWADKKNTLGFFGSFEVTIIDRKKIEGFWIGHSNVQPTKINTHHWKLLSVVDNTKWLVPLQLKIYFKRMYKRFKSKNTTANNI